MLGHKGGKFRIASRILRTSRTIFTWLQQLRRATSSMLACRRILVQSCHSSSNHHHHHMSVTCHTNNTHSNTYNSKLQGEGLLHSRTEKLLHRLFRAIRGNRCRLLKIIKCSNSRHNRMLPRPTSTAFRGKSPKLRLACLTRVLRSKKCRRLLTTRVEVLHLLHPYPRPRRQMRPP